MKKIVSIYKYLLVAVVFSVGTISASAQTWNAAASMTGIRHAHTATLLSNGKVLVTGGYGTGGYLSSCELYDSATNTWSAAASMAGSRYVHTATLLFNGKVLVTGGQSGGILTSCELYDPLTNTWSATASMTYSRYIHTATLLSNGKVLVTGGSPYLIRCELYDPVTNTWSDASMTGGRYHHTATLLSNGKVLVTAGYNGVSLSSCELYDPATNTWSAAASMAGSRNNHTATLLSNGKVLVTAGSVAVFLTSCELYDPVTNTWSVAASMGGSRYSHTATLLSNGEVLVTAGYNGVTLSSCELYDPGTGIWSTTGSMAGSRYAHTATLLSNGKVLVTGGYNGSNLNSCELYNSCLAPTFSICPSNITANAATGTCGANVSYAATATGTPNPTVTYSFSGATTDSGNGTGNGSTFNKGVTNVAITASNGCGSDDICNFTVTVNDNQQPVITCPSDSPYTKSTNEGLCTYKVVGTEFDATTTDNCDTPTLDWDITGATTNSGTGSMEDVYLNFGENTITWTATDEADNESNCFITVTVNLLPTVNAGTPSTICSGNSAAIGAIAVVGNTYSWVSNPAGFTSALANPTVSPTETTTYTLTETTTATGCIKSNDVVITVNPLPVADAGSDKTVYRGYPPSQCATLSGSASEGTAPYQYLWSTGATTAAISVCLTTTTTYILTVTDSNGCSKTDDVTVNVIDVRCDKNKVKVCHSKKTICVKIADVQFHLAHGDYLGVCTSTNSHAFNMDSFDSVNGNIFVVYPNPTRGSFTVEVCRNDTVEQAKIQIINSLGQIIYSKELSKIEGCTKEAIELDHALPEAMYFLNLIIKGNVETKKIILTK